MGSSTSNRARGSQGEQSLEHYSVEDGDHLGLIIEHPPDGQYRLLAVPDSETVFAAIRSTDARPPTSDQSVTGVRPADIGRASSTNNCSASG